MKAGKINWFAIYDNLSVIKFDEPNNKEPDGLRKGIGYLTGINEKGYIEVTSQDYAAEDPRCCPSIEHKQFFKYKNGKFEVVK